MSVMSVMSDLRVVSVVSVMSVVSVVSVVSEVSVVSAVSECRGPKPGAANILNNKLQGYTQILNGFSSGFGLENWVLVVDWWLVGWLGGCRQDGSC